MPAAARDADLGRVRTLLAGGSDVNTPAADGTTALLWAVYQGNGELVSLLLDAGADPDLANQLAITPVLQAARLGDAALLASLLDAGASLDPMPADTESPLMAAARAGRAAAVQVLLEAGADPNRTDPRQQQSALMWAVAEGHLAVARLLLQSGANPDQRARVSTLTERKNADFPSGGFAAMHWAARNGDKAIIALLLEHGADIDIRNGDGATPMMLAIVNDRFDLAAWMLARGANPDDGSLYYATVMRDATTDWRARDGTVYRADHPNTLTALDLTHALLEAGADPNRVYRGQMHNESMCCDTKADATPFYRAAVAADVAGMQLMLDHGADVHWRPQLPEPEATGAADADAAMPVPGPGGKSALMVAINGGKGVGVAGGPNDLRYGPPPFREPANRDPFDAVRLLLDAGADVALRDPDGQTALHIAVRALHPGMVRALVAHGADLEAGNGEGKTPLQLAREMKAPEPTPGFYFEAPPALPDEMAALLITLGAADDGRRAP